MLLVCVFLRYTMAPCSGWPLLLVTVPSIVHVPLDCARARGAAASRIAIKPSRRLRRAPRRLSIILPPLLPLGRRRLPHRSLHRLWPARWGRSRPLRTRFRTRRRPRRPLRLRPLRQSREGFRIPNKSAYIPPAIADRAKYGFVIDA